MISVLHLLRIIPLSVFNGMCLMIIAQVCGRGPDQQYEDDV